MIKPNKSCYNWHISEVKKYLEERKKMKEQIEKLENKIEIESETRDYELYAHKESIDELSFKVDKQEKYIIEQEQRERECMLKIRRLVVLFAVSILFVIALIVAGM